MASLFWFLPKFETVFGTFQTTDISSGPKKVVQEPEIRTRLARSDRFWHLQYLLPWLKWNRVVLREQWLPQWLKSFVVVWLTYSISVQAIESLHQCFQIATSFKVGIQVSQETGVRVLALYKWLGTATDAGRGVDEQNKFRNPCSTLCYRSEHCYYRSTAKSYDSWLLTSHSVCGTHTRVSPKQMRVPPAHSC